MAGPEEIVLVSGASKGEAKSASRPALVVMETHPIQYRAPVYRALNERYGIPVTVIYGSDFSVAKHYDTEFQCELAWDVDLLSGYRSVFLSRVNEGGAANSESVSARGSAQTLRELNPGAILLSGYSPRFHQLAWWHAMWSGRPLLFRGETTGPAQSTGSIKRTARDLLLRLLYAKCAKILYIGQQARNHYVAHGCAEEKLVFSPYCVDFAPFQPDEKSRSALRQGLRASIGADDGDLVILFSGKLSRRKGPDLLIEAIRSLPDSLRSKTIILFLGSGELLSSLAATAATEPAVRTHFAGFQNQHALSQYFHASDIFVLPSRKMETWGLVVNEALHHGLPCVVSDRVGCAPDLIVPGVTGETFESDSAAALAEALQRVHSLAGRLEVRDACRRRAADYSVDNAAEGIAAAYESAIG